MNSFSIFLQLNGPSKGGLGYLFIFILFLILGIVLLLYVEKYVKKRDERAELCEEENNRRVVEKIMEVYKPKQEVSMVEDSPISFGYKTSWLAIKTIDINDLAKELALTNIQPANWESGLQHAYYNSIFITPPIGEWVLVVGDISGNYSGNKNHSAQKKIIEKLSSRFGEAQYFGSHRVSDYYYWMKAEKGSVVRVYGTSDDGEVYGEGEPTEFEKTLNLRDQNSHEAKMEGYDEREDLITADEELVLQIAENWSINPGKLDEMTGIKGHGLLGELP